MEPAPDLFGWPYALMDRLPGEQLAGLVARKMVGAGDRLRLAARLGDALAEVQALTWPVAGAFDPATGSVRPTAVFKPDLESLRSYALPPGLDAPAFVREFIARSRRAAPDATTAADEAWAEAVIARAGMPCGSRSTPAACCRTTRKPTWPPCASLGAGGGSAGSST